MGQKAAHTQLEGVLIGVHRPWTLSIGEPCLEAGGGRTRGRRGRQSHPLFHLPLARGHGSSRFLLPPFRCHPTGGTMNSLPLFMCPYDPIGGMSHFLPCGIHEWIDIS
jgi:hypothetical protein